jgi:ribosomal protein L37AE/L43A
VCYKRRMALNRELIDILACPKCKGRSSSRDDQSAFECGNCKLAYPSSTTSRTSSSRKPSPSNRCRG